MDNSKIVYVLLDSMAAASGSVGMMTEVFDSLSGKKHLTDPDGFSDYLESIGRGMAQHNPDISVYIGTPLSLAVRHESGVFAIIKDGTIGSLFNIKLHPHTAVKNSAVTA